MAKKCVQAIQKKREGLQDETYRPSTGELLLSGQDSTFSLYAGG